MLLAFQEEIPSRVCPLAAGLIIDIYGANFVKIGGVVSSPSPHSDR